MRKHLFNWGIKLARKFAEPRVAVFVLEAEYLAEARSVVRTVNGLLPDKSAETKHSQAVFLLRQRCPAVPTRKLGLAIELAVNDVR